MWVLLFLKSDCEYLIVIDCVALEVSQKGKTQASDWLVDFFKESDLLNYVIGLNHILLFIVYVLGSNWEWGEGLCAPLD